PLVATVPAPAGGTSTVVNLPVKANGLSITSYSGTATLTTNVPTAIVGGPAPVAFDVADFSISPNLVFPVQNVPIGGSATLAVTVSVQGVGTPFAIPVTAVSAPNLTFLPPSQGSSGSGNVPFMVSVGAAMTPGQGTITINATNHGIT